MELLRTFEGLGRDDAALAGGKGASLGEMTQAGIPVPPGFVVLSHAFERFIEETDIDVEIDAILHTVNREEVHTVERASAAIQELILNAEMPEDIRSLVMAEFRKLDAEFVAVRSSATAEDSASAAWAGQLDSFLNTTEETLLKNVQRCWASLFTPRAIFYRFEKELHLTKISVAVVVQKMVASEISGIAFSVHPVTEDHNQLIIEAGYGLGEAIVSGQVTPDSYVVEKDPRRILDSNISTQSRALFRKEGSAGGNEWRDIAEPRASAQVLTEPQIHELSDIIIRIEDHYGFPCDIEWAFERGEFYIVQSRPITTLTQSPADANKEVQWSYWGSWKGPVLWISVWYYVPHSRAYRELGFKERGVTGDEVYLDGHFFTPTEDFKKLSKDVTESLEGTSDWVDRALAICYQEIERFAALETQKDLPLFLEAAKEQCSCSLLTRYIDHNLEAYARALCARLGFAYDELLTYMQSPKRLPSAEYFAGLKDVTEETAEAYAHTYAWLASNYFTGDPTLTKEKVLEDKAHFTTHAVSPSPTSLPTELQRVVAIGQELSYLRTYFAELFTKVTFAYRDDLKALATRDGITFEDIMSHTGDEVIARARGELSVSPDCAARRKGVGVETRGGVFRVFVGEELAAYLEQFKKYYAADKSAVEVPGTIGGKGVTRGRARVVLSAREAVRVEEGDIIVASETTPDYVPAMRKAVAFVTDQGGITSHAAIIAREMQKPCIIGTRVATQVIQDGDLIEVDGHTGVVRILERAIH